jgi:CubicO group peptidase (beta-lactamase class C family)
MTTTIPIHGTCKNGFERVKDAFAQNFADGHEVGAALSLVVDGETVLDLWGGYADPGRTRPWTQDTIVNVYSTTKGLTATCAHRLVDQGKLDLDAPVAKYWPEFAQAGKADLPVRYLLSHRAGLSAVSTFIAADDGYKWEPLRDALAAQEPWWEPGTKFGYHALTFGTLVGEVIRRISGMTVGEFFRKEIAEPLGMDTHIGFGPELDSRVAEMIPAGLDGIDPENPTAKALMDPTSLTFKSFWITPMPFMDPLYMNKRGWREAEIPAANGHSDARSLARMYGALARGGEIDGYRVLSREQIDVARTEQSYGEDAILMMPMRFGLGYHLDIPEFQMSPTGAIFGHAGMGGSFGYADPEAKLGIGYVINRMMMPPDMIDPRWKPMIDAIYASV